MFGWVTRWRRRRRSRGRLLFAYDDGRAEVYGEPMALHRGLERELGDNWHRKVFDLRRLRKPRPGLSAALQKARADERDSLFLSLSAAARKVFSLRPFDHTDATGLTDGECLGVLTAFTAFMLDVAEDTRPLPSSPGRSDTVPAGPTSEPSSASTGTATPSPEPAPTS